MGKLKAVDARSLWRSMPLGLGLVTLVPFIIAACGGGNGHTEPTSAPAAAAQPPAVDQQTTRSPDATPEFQITLFQNDNHTGGEVLNLSDLVGQPVVLNFWFPSCPPCVAEMPDLEQAFQKYKDQGVQFIGVQAVGLDSAEDGQNFIADIGVNYALGPDEDSSIIRAYEVRGFPTTWFLNKDHEVVRKWDGFLNLEVLDEVIPQLLN